MTKLWDESLPIGTKELGDLLKILSPKFPRYVAATINHEGENHLVMSYNIENRTFDAGIVSTAKNRDFIYINAAGNLREIEKCDIGLTPVGLELLNQIELKDSLITFRKSSDAQSQSLFLLTVIIAALAFIQAEGTCLNGNLACNAARDLILLGSAAVFIMVIFRYFYRQT